MATKTKFSEYYQAGDIIYQGKPFAKALQHEVWDKVCANCTVAKSTLKSCGSCGVKKYCGKSCQKQDWADHKLECPFLRNYTDRENQTFVQLVGNVILKVKDKDWKTITETLMDKEVSFDDLISHSGTEKDPCLLLDIEVFKTQLISYFGVENLPDDYTLKEIIGKVHVNGFGGSDVAPNIKFLFLGASKFDHSCVPNSARHIQKTTWTMTVKATKAIHKKTEKVTFLYGPIVTKIDSHIYYLDMKHSFVDKCYCGDCSQPFGESVLTKIIDARKARSVLEETHYYLNLVSLLKRLGYPTGIVTRDKLKQLLQKQEGVLGKTNLLRIRTLAIRSLFLDGPSEDIRKDLVELEEAMIEVWGDNFDEIYIVYQKLIEINLKLGKVENVNKYVEKLEKLEFVYGQSENMNYWKQYSFFISKFTSFLKHFQY